MSSIGRYEIASEIGRGAMGVVYLAYDPRLRRRVAVKTYAFPDGISEEEKSEFRERFLREAQVAAALSNPGIVTVYDVDADPARDLPFIAMEYVPGQTLGETFKTKGPLSVDRMRAVVGVLTEALQVAHEAGIVHRDIKPANLLVRESDGAVKIADFGIARLSSSTLTREGISVGSPAYMSPEQIRGEELDGRSDLFSLAVVVYEMLSGQRPFTGDDPAALVYSVAHETPVPISKRRPGLPAALDSFFDRALAKDRARRFADGARFRSAFEDACRQGETADVEATIRQAAEKTIVRVPVPAEPVVPVTGVLSDWDESVPGRPGKVWAVAIATVVLLAWAGWAILGKTEETFLRLEAKSSIESGKFKLLVDGDEVYQHDLAGPHKKRGLLKKVLDKDLETFEAWIEVEPGKHEVVALVDAAGSGAYRDTIVVDLVPGETRRLKLSAGRKFGSDFALKAD